MTDFPLEAPPRRTVFNTPIIRPLLRWIFVPILKLLRWESVVNLPEARSYLVIVAPHTSYWDFLMGLGWAFKHKQRIHWFGKHTLFRGPFRPFFRWLGGIPIDTARSGDGRVAAAIAAFEADPELKVGLAPEATLRPMERWRSGFYHIALGAGIPIALAFIDYGTKRLGIDGALMPTGDEKADWDAIRAFYAPMHGKRPGRFVLPRNGLD